jgi:hypothetical protein
MLVVRQVKVLAVEAADSVVEAVMTSEEVEVTGGEPGESPELR